MVTISDKTCSCCNKIKPISEFFKRKSSKDGYRGKCKECLAPSIKINKEKYRNTENGKAKISEYKKSSKYKEYAKEYRQRECVKEYMRDKMNQYNKTSKGIEYLKSEKYREIQRKSQKKYSGRKRKTANGNLAHRMSVAVQMSLKEMKSGRKWESLVGYTVYDLKEHLEGLFTEGMTWEKLLNAEIHIDHKIPKSYFTYESPEDDSFKKCWSLENLQPLWAKDNLSKGNRYVS